jgi:hypothetical protein
MKLFCGLLFGFTSLAPALAGKGARQRLELALPQAIAGGLPAENFNYPKLLP